MPYKPKHCCQCGEKIDRIDWKFWTSRRFCELCETDYFVHDWLLRSAFGIALLLGLFGIGNFFLKSEKTLDYSPKQFLSGVSSNNSEIINQKEATQLSPDKVVKSLVETGNSALQTKSPEMLTKPDLTKNQVEISHNEVAEVVYFCGAQTKKGTLCSRRVKGGGRCWQHLGQPAMLPQTKLMAAK